MGVGVTQLEPLTAMRAVLRIEEARVVDSKYADQKGREQKQFATSLKVLSGAEERNGEVFSEWFAFPEDGAISAKSKAGQLLTAALAGDATAETLENLAAKLIGRTFVAQIGVSRDGQYPRVVHDTIGPAPAAKVNAEAKPQAPKPEQSGNPEEDYDDIPW